MAYSLPTAFFAYPSQPPALAETIRSAVEQINASKQTYVRTWEDTNIGGKPIIHEICKAIDDADLLLADLTGLNPNVLFEVGYAISKNKRIWGVLDASLSKSDFLELKTLSTIGYVAYASSTDISKAYFKERPQDDLLATLQETLIKPNLQAGHSSTFLYLKSQHETDASVQITKRLEAVPYRLIVDDPRESPSQTLTWYGQQVYLAESLLCHFTNPARQGARIRNARYALVAGMAHGLGKSVLVLSEGDYLAPLDYRDILRQYQTAAAAGRHLEAWLTPLEEAWRTNQQTKEQHSARLRLATELKSLNLGEYIAENESERLVDGYFMETTAYREALSGTHTIFVGRKGTGKSANFLQLGASLQADVRNILSVIKPVAYELEGILRVIRSYADRDKKVYVIESLWKFLLYSEIAGALALRIRPKVAAARTEREMDFLTYFDEMQSILTGDFSSRLERCIAALEARQGAGASIDDFRKSIAESIHAGFIHELKARIAKAIPRGGRIAIIFDNLDKAWDRQGELQSLAEFLLGLLSAASGVRHEIKKDAPQIDVSLALFLRADIFERVQQAAREPDKIKHTRLNWTDHELLYRLVEERFAAANSDDVPRETLWTKFFCPKVRDTETKEFLAGTVLPRPRDFLYLVNTSIGIAVNRRHAKVQQDDILEARKAYSEFATSILLIEDNSQNGVLEKIVYEFAGATPLLSNDDVRARLLRADVAEGEIEGVIAQLCSLSFFGIEVYDDDFRFPDSATELKMVSVLSRQLCEARKSRPRYVLHRAFRPFLEVAD